MDHGLGWFISIHDVGGVDVIDNDCVRLNAKDSIGLAVVKSNSKSSLLIASCPRNCW